MRPTRSRYLAQIHNPVLWALALVLLIGNLQGIAPVESYMNVIAYTCDDGHDHEICVMNADGSELRQLTHNNSNDTAPSINRYGLIAYGCEFDDEAGLKQQEICVIHLDGTGERRLTYTPYTKSNPVINDDGWVIYRCIIRGESICRAHVDHEVEANFPGQNILGRYYDLNDNGEVVYACRGAGSQGFNEICFIDVEGNNRRILSDMDLSIVSLALNNLGQIVFECTLTQTLDLEKREICAITTSGNDFRQLTQNGYLDGLPSINDDGVVVYECGVDSSSTEEICATNFDGTGFSQLTRDNLDDGYVAISPTGVVAYICRERDSEICTVNADGTGFRQLTNNISDESNPVIN